VYLYAYKYIYTPVDAQAGTFGTEEETVSNTVYTAAFESGSVTAGGTLTTTAVDPIYAVANANHERHEDDEQLSDSQWMELVERGDISATANVFTDSVIESGYREGANVTARGGIHVISELENFVATANAEMTSPSGRMVFDGDEFLKSKVFVVAANPQYKTLRTSIKHLCPGASFLGHVFHSRMESFAIERFDSQCDKGRRGSGNGSGKRDGGDNTSDARMDFWSQYGKDADLLNEKSEKEMPQEAGKTEFANASSLSGAIDRDANEDESREFKDSSKSGSVDDFAIDLSWTR